MSLTLGLHRASVRKMTEARDPSVHVIFRLVYIHEVAISLRLGRPSRLAGCGNDFDLDLLDTSDVSLGCPLTCGMQA
jgi:hypothetical protein